MHITNPHTAPTHTHENGVQSTMLHTTDNGPHSSILKAPPREPGLSRPHSHTATEEIFNLGPPFTFDKGRTLPRYGYTKYPAGMVHGADVDLPEGYHLYVRMSGPSEIHFPEININDPQPFTPLEGYTFVASADENWPENPGPNLGQNIQTRTLSYNPKTQKGAFLARLPANTTLNLPPAATELLIVEGSLTHENNTLTPGTHIHTAQGLNLTASAPSLVFIHQD